MWNSRIEAVLLCMICKKANHVTDSRKRSDSLLKTRKNCEIFFDAIIQLIVKHINSFLDAIGEQ